MAFKSCCEVLSLSSKNNFRTSTPTEKWKDIYPNCYLDARYHFLYVRLFPVPVQYNVTPFCLSHNEISVSVSVYSGKPEIPRKSIFPWLYTYILTLIIWWKKGKLLESTCSIIPGYITSVYRHYHFHSSFLLHAANGPILGN
jgi:hypothetical protein